MTRLRWILTLFALWLASVPPTGASCAQTTAGAELRSLRVRLSWGYRSSQATPWFVRLVPGASGMQIPEAAGWNLEESEKVAAGVGRTTAGAGDVDGVEFTLSYQESAESTPRTAHSIWNYLLTHSDAGTVNRLRGDPAFHVDPRLLTVQLNEEGTRGFSVSIEQLLRERALWVPDLDVFLAAGDELLTLEQHQAAIQPYAGQRILDQLEREPVEHRWGWGQYFGPPSTDGAWFDLYRHMLIQEPEDETLFLLPATPRKWLEDGKQIEIRRAPTYFGPLSITVDSRAASGTIRANLDVPQRCRPRELIVRLRHPAGKRMTAVKVNGADWPHFEPDKESVRITDPDQPHYEIVASYR